MIDKGVDGRRHALSVRFAALALVLVVVVTGCRPRSKAANRAAASSTGPITSPLPTPTKSFAEMRAAHRTHLLVHGPSPQKYDPWPTSGSSKVVSYSSGALTLKGLYTPASNPSLTKAGRAPLLVFLHGGNALGIEDVDDCAPFAAAGFAIWAPGLRGENGNPGEHEDGYSELDDAKAAIIFGRSLPDVDPARVFLFGHSAGGLLAGLVSLSAEPKVAYTGSAGGTYLADVFDYTRFPFEDTDDERLLRTFASFPADIHQSHFACVGTEDRLVLRGATQLETKVPARPATVAVDVIRVPGTHHSSLAACMSAYLAKVLPLAR